jgi:N-methylhydantoinase B/oxoprolinase/acetone carboxylase alpha subunit
VTGTGGGYGDPRERERELVRRDLVDGMISEHDAREIYGLEPES